MLIVDNTHVLAAPMGMGLIVNNTYLTSSHTMAPCPTFHSSHYLSIQDSGSTVIFNTRVLCIGADDHLVVVILGTRTLGCLGAMMGTAALQEVVGVVTGVQMVKKMGTILATLQVPSGCGGHSVCAVCYR